MKATMKKTTAKPVMKNGGKTPKKSMGGKMVAPKKGMGGKMKGGC